MSNVLNDRIANSGKARESHASLGSRARLSTTLQHAGAEYRVGKGLVSATETSVTFRSPSNDDDPVYQRLSNTSNNRELRAVLAQAFGGEDAFVTNSGMAALTLILATELRPGDEIICQEDCYGSTRGLLENVMEDWGIVTRFCKAKNMAEHIGPRTRALLVETISNPFCEPQDVVAVCALARKFGLLSIVDNTFASPYNCRPTEFGADYVWESATKYLNGHSDQVAGVVIASKQRIAKTEKRAMYLGCFLSSESCVRLLRGLRTFALRMERHNQNGAAFAAALSSIQGVDRVFYGFHSVAAASDPVLDSMSKVLSGFGGMVCLRFASDVDVHRVCAALKYAADVPSLGGTETTVCMPLHTTHKWTAPELRQSLGIDGQVLRVSVGLEDTADIVGDFRQAVLASVGV
jgi:cystathionine beta-lyase/cystathionine gamma-synthase